MGFCGKNALVFRRALLPCEHATPPVKREYRSNVSGSVIEMSNKGGTRFIEPASVGKLQSVLDELKIEEDSEIRRILYSLTAMISENLKTIRMNMEAMETLDFIFAGES